jgi:hypothetical protein
MGKMLTVFLFLIILIPARAAAQLNLKPAPAPTAPTLHLQVLPQNFYTRQLGYFCKKEVQVQKLTMMPIYLRLGSKEYVDYMESRMKH